MGQKEKSEFRNGEESLNVGSNAMKLELVKTECNEYKEKLYRVLAEMENQRKRFKFEKENAEKYALEEFIAKMLPAKDSLEKGLQIAYSDNDVDEDVLISGMTATLKICFDAFSASGVEEINPMGKMFNPDLHEALNTKKDDSVINNVVLKVYQKGYLLNDRLIRPARVEVSSS